MKHEADDIVIELRSRSGRSSATLVLPATMDERERQRIRKMFEHRAQIETRSAGRKEPRP